MLKEILTARTRPSDKALYNIWARKISGGWTETTLTGSLPLTFRAKGGDLTDYTVHGTAEGAGVQTENLFDKNATDTNNGYISDRYITNAGVTQNNQNYIVSEYIPCNENTTYYLSSLVDVGTAVALCFYDQSYSFISGERILNATNVTSPADAAYIRTTVQKTLLDSAMILKNYSPSYIPYGYQIPLSITDGTNSEDYVLYIGDTKLGADEHLSFAEQKIYKDVSGTLTPTDPPLPFPAISAYQGENTMSSTETVESVSLTGKIKEVTL